MASVDRAVRTVTLPRGGMWGEHSPGFWQEIIPDGNADNGYEGPAWGKDYPQYLDRDEVLSRVAELEDEIALLKLDCPMCHAPRWDANGG